MEALERGQQFVTHGVWVIGRPGEEMPSGFIIKNLRVAILLFTSLWEGTLLLRASALAFATVLSIVPFLAIMFYVVTVLHLDEGIYQVFEERLEGTLSRMGEFFDASSKNEEQALGESAEELASEAITDTVRDTSPVEEEAEEALLTAEARGPPEEEMGIAPSDLMKGLKSRRSK